MKALELCFPMVLSDFQSFNLFIDFGWKLYKPYTLSIQAKSLYKLTVNHQFCCLYFKFLLFLAKFFYKCTKFFVKLQESKVRSYLVFY